MILLDANLLIYAWDQSSPHHWQAAPWLDQQLNGIERIGIPWVSSMSFLRLVTNPRIFPNAESVARAWQQVQDWLACPGVWIPQAGDRHQQILDRMLSVVGSGGNLVPDAHLAAIAIEHGLTLCSTDGDFARFPGLRWANPLRK